MVIKESLEMIYPKCSVWDYVDFRNIIKIIKDATIENHAKNVTLPLLLEDTNRSNISKDIY